MQCHSPSVSIPYCPLNFENPLKACVFCTRPDEGDPTISPPSTHDLTYPLHINFLVQTYTHRPRVMSREKHVSGAASSGVKCASDSVTLRVFAQVDDTYHAGFYLFSAQTTFTHRRGVG
jgi:hypothetical protein